MVTLVKDSSLAYIVGVGELSFVASQVNARTMVYPAEIFMLVGAIYWLLCTGLDRLANAGVKMAQAGTKSSKNLSAKGLERFA